MIPARRPQDEPRTTVPTQTPGAERSEPGLSGRRSQVVVGVLAFSGILAALMQTIIVPLVGDLPRLLDTSAGNASWVITSTLLTAAITTPISGRLGDMYGKRRVLVICIVLLIAGSLICAASSTLALVVLGRVLQGFATSVIPLGISILRDELSKDRVPGAIALISATLGIGASIGMPVSALVAQHFDWHVLFLGAAGFGLVALLLVLRVVPESPVRSPGRFDLPGAVGLAVGLFCLLLALNKGTSWGWAGPRVLGLLAVAVVVLTGWTWFERRVTQPLVDIRVSASRPVLLANIAAVLSGFAMYAQMLITPQLLQAPAATGYGLGRSVLVAGLCLAPSGFVMMLLSPVAGRITRTVGPKVTLVVGLAVMGGGYVMALFLSSAVWQIALVSSVIGAGVGLTYSAMPALIMGAVPVHETGSANGLNALSRYLGTAFSSAVISIILTNLTTSFAGRAIPSLDAFRLSFAIGALAAAAALVTAAFLPGRPRAPGAATVGTDLVRPVPVAVAASS